MIFSLGSKLFQGFELPEKLTLGGEQALVVQKVIGGRRVVHSMGPDDAPIEWSGRLMGETAALRAFQLDLVRRSGRELELRVGIRAYSVVIRRFQASQERPYLFSYTIAVEIVKDLVAGDGGKESNSVESQVLADLAAAEAAALARDQVLFAVSLASTAVRAALGDKTALRGLGTLALQEAQVLVGDAVIEATGDAGQANLAIASVGFVGGVVSGGNPTTMAANLVSTAVASEVANQSGLAAANMTRVGANLSGVAV